MAGELPSQAILVARMSDLDEVVHVVETALADGIVRLPLAVLPQGPGPYTLELYGPGIARPLLLSARIVGERAGGKTPCEVRPLDPTRLDALKKFIATRTVAAPSSPPARASGPAPSSHDPMLGRVLTDKYVVERVLGAGGMGRVYQARHLALDRPVAVKVLHGTFMKDPLFISRFHREARSASKLDHPNVARVLDFGEEPDGLLYIVMELLVGEPLRTVLDEVGRLSLPRAIELMSQICAGISVAHEQGIIHRDLKPGNVVLVRSRDDDGMTIEVAKVCDFGLATIQDSAEGTAAGKGARAQTAAGTVCGTPDYISPEQGKGETVDARSDIYSCGAMFYEMATGQLPFSKSSAIAQVMAHIMEEPKPPSSICEDLDPRVDAAILKAMSKDPAKRPQSMRDLRAELRALLRPVPASPAQSISGVRPAVPDLELDPLASKTPPPFPPRTLEPPALVVPTSSRAAPRTSIADVPMSMRPGEQAFSALDDEEDSGAALELAVPQRVSWVTAARATVVQAAPAHRLEDPASRFYELFVEIARAIDRVTQRRVDRVELQRLLVPVVRLGEIVLRSRGEVTFSRRDVHDASQIVLTSAAGDQVELAKAVGAGVGTAFATVLSDLFVRRRLLSFALKEGLQLAELADLIEFLGGEDDERLRQRLRSSLRVSVLFPPDLLGRTRKLPWPVDLALSRIARDLRALASTPGQEDRVVERAPALVADVVRGIASPELVRALLEHVDLVESSLGGLAVFQGFDLRYAILVSVQAPVSLQIARAALQDPRADSARKILEACARRYVRERSNESDEILIELVRRKAMPTADLPEDLRTSMQVEELTDRIAKSPDRAVAALDASTDLASYARESNALAMVASRLARRGEVVVLHMLLLRLHRDAKGAQPGDANREQLAARALRAFVDPKVVAAVADTMLTGAPTSRESAQALLVAYGMSGARALCSARRRAGFERAVRTRFSEALRDMGPRVVPIIGETLGALDADANDPQSMTMIEDLLRAVPNATHEATGHIAAKLAGHRIPPVRRAATAAVLTLLGARSRPVLVANLDDADDGVRIAALTGLRALQSIDSDVVSRIDRMLSGAVSASDELRAVAAAVLADAAPAARSSAGITLRRALEPKPRRLFAGEQSENGMLVETVARSLIALGGEEGRRVVEQRAAKSTGEVRDRLIKLLGQR